MVSDGAYGEAFAAVGLKTNHSECLLTSDRADSVTSDLISRITLADGPVGLVGDS